MRVRLGDVATYINGYAFKPEDWSNTGVPIIRIQDLTGNSYQANRYNGEYAIKYEINEGDVLISWSASLGVYIWHGEKAVLNQHIFKVVFDKMEVSKNFFVYQVENILEKAELSVHGATMKHLTKPVFDALQFYLPSLEEQRKIASILDKVSDLITKRRKQLDKLDELVKARFVEMFGDPVSNPYNWNMVTVGDICFVTKLAGFEYTEYIKYQNCGDVIMVRGLNVKEKKLKLDDVYYIDEDISNMLPRSQLKENDIVMTYVGVNIGDVALVDGDNKYHLAPNVAKISPLSFDVLNPVFFVNLLAFNKENFALNATSTAKQALNMDRIRKLSVMMPTVALQNEFAAFVHKTDNSKSAIKKSLEKLELLKKALMQEYFGE